MPRARKSGFYFGKSLDDFERRLKKIKPKTEEKAMVLVRKTANKVFMLTRRIYAPVDTGKMIGEANISFSYGFNGVMIGEVFYPTEYAMDVNQNTDDGSPVEHPSWRHGSLFNQDYADLISAGLVRAKKPTETEHFIEKAIEDVADEFYDGLNKVLVL